MITRPNPNAVPAGMTLVELMIVLAILAILAAVAWPSYQNAVQRSRRADAVAGLTEIMQAQERWRAKYPSYRASFAAVGTEAAWPTESRDRHDSLWLENVTANGYTVRASVRDGSPQSADSNCLSMRVTMAGGNIAYTSGASADATNAGNPDPCWQK